tara:strand:+ start:175 stop:762 length:588 start_codon:yes stop_codon:yes gene_type:complete
MKSVYGFVIKPIGERYNNTKKVGDKELIVNTEVFNHQYVNRKAKVISTPIIGNTEIEVNDDVIVHHNVFRRWHDQHGKERNSGNYFNEDTYIVYIDQIFAYKRYWRWQPLKGYNFIQPLKQTNPLYNEKEKLKGIVKYTDGCVKEGDIVGFLPIDKYEFVINGERLYRVKSNAITIKYENKRNEEAYNPSWAQGS